MGGGGQSIADISIQFNALPNCQVRGDNLISSRLNNSHGYPLFNNFLEDFLFLREDAKNVKVQDFFCWGPS